MKNVILGIISVLILIIGISIGWLIWYNKPITNTQGDYFKDKNFKTDTVTIFGPGIHDTLMKSYPIHLPAQTIIKYQEYSTHDTIFRDTGKTVNSQYLGYNRLIYGEISKDTILLDFQKDNNQPQRSIYFSNYSKYKYQILNNRLNVMQLSTPIYDSPPPIKRNIEYTGTYIYFGDQISDKLYSAGISSGLNIYKLRIVGYGSQPFNGASKDPNFGIRIGFKLF